MLLYKKILLSLSSFFFLKSSLLGTHMSVYVENNSQDYFFVQAVNYENPTAEGSHKWVVLPKESILTTPVKNIEDVYLIKMIPKEHLQEALAESKNFPQYNGWSSFQLEKDLLSVHAHLSDLMPDGCGCSDIEKTYAFVFDFNEFSYESSSRKNGKKPLTQNLGPEKVFPFMLKIYNSSCKKRQLDSTYYKRNFDNYFKKCFQIYKSFNV